MHKRGQVSVFVIVGVVLVILVALFFFLRYQLGFFVSPTKFLDEKAKPIEDNLKNCVNKITSDSLVKFGRQGGDFSPSSSVFYQSMNVKYFCTNIPSQDKCLNVMPPFEELVDNLNREVEAEVKNCLDKSLVESKIGYQVQAGELTTDITASGSNLLVRANYNVEITKGETKTSIRGVTVNFDVPLEELYVVSVDVINSEANAGFFEQLLYMLNKKGAYIINIDKPYPDKVYKINKKDNDFEFWFAVQGERG